MVVSLLKCTPFQNTHNQNIIYLDINIKYKYKYSSNYPGTSIGNWHGEMPLDENNN